MVVQEFVLIPYTMYKEVTALLNAAKNTSGGGGGGTSIVSPPSASNVPMEVKETANSSQTTDTPPSAASKPIDVYQETLEGLSHHFKFGSAPHNRSIAIVEKLKNNERLDVTVGGKITLDRSETGVNLLSFLIALQTSAKGIPEEFYPILRVLDLSRALFINRHVRTWQGVNSIQTRATTTPIRWDTLGI